MNAPDITSISKPQDIIDHYLTIVPSTPYWAFVLSGKTRLTEEEYREWDAVVRVMFGSMDTIPQLGCCLGWWVPSAAMMFDSEDIPINLENKQEINKYTSIHFYRTTPYPPPFFNFKEGTSQFYEYVKFNRSTNNFYLIKLKQNYFGFPNTDTFFKGMKNRVNQEEETIGNYIDIYNSFYAEKHCGYVITQDSARNFMRLSDFVAYSLSSKHNVGDVGYHNLLSDLHNDVVPGSPCETSNCVSLIVGNEDDKWEALTTAYPSDNSSPFLLFTYGNKPSWQMLPTTNSVIYDIDRGMPNLQSSNGYPHLQPHNFPPPDFYYYGTSDSGSKGFWPLSKFDCNKSSGVDTLTNIRSRFALCSDCRIDSFGSFLGLYEKTVTEGTGIFYGTREIRSKYIAYIKLKVVCKIRYPTHIDENEFGQLGMEPHIGEEMWDVYETLGLSTYPKYFLSPRFNYVDLDLKFCKDEGCSDCLPPLNFNNYDYIVEVNYFSYSLITNNSSNDREPATIEIYVVLGIIVDDRIAGYLKNNDYKYVCLSGTLDTPC